MIHTECKQHLTEIHQEHVLFWWDELTKKQQTKLAHQIETLDFDTLKIQQDVLFQEKKTESLPSPPKKSFHSGHQADIERGGGLLASGKAGCLILAGGMGSRLKHEGPKGTYPVTLTQKSLFRYVSEKIAAASTLYGCDLPVAIMTSELNDIETRKDFQNHGYFGLKSDQIDFFTQKNLPLLDQQGNLFLDSKWHIAEGPNGNGDCLKEFYRSNIWKKWKEAGVEYVNVILIDNPLADPFDPELLGIHDRLGTDLMIKVIKRIDPEEKVGVIVKIDDKIHVLEYSEIEDDMLRIDEYPFANLSLFSVSLDFIGKSDSFELPLHKAYKTAPFLAGNGNIALPEAPTFWKFETFIFDVFPKGNAELISYPREKTFAPLKRQTGADCPETVLAALQENDRRVYEAISGLKAPNRPFELDPRFYYPTKELLDKWKGRPLPESDYIEP